MSSKEPATAWFRDGVAALPRYGLILGITTISTFATPAVGAAYLTGTRDVMALEFSPVLTLITGVALLLAVAGNIILGLATTGASLPTQPVGALLLAISSAWLAWTVLRSRPARELTKREMPASVTARAPK
jgi:TRAP-type mannitol/chloroaromatic compound transport system permease large subunit